MTVRAVAAWVALWATGAGADPLTLDEALGQIDGSSVEVLEARARVDLAQARQRTALAGLLPRLEVAGAISRNSLPAELDFVVPEKGYSARPLVGPGIPAGSLELTPNEVTTLTVQPLTQLSVTAQATVPLLDLPAVGRVRATGTRARASGLQLQRVRFEARIRIWEGLLQARAAEQLVSISQARLKVAREQEQAARQRTRSGELAPLAMARAAATAAAAERTLRLARANEVGARLAIAAQLGRDEHFAVGAIASPAAAAWEVDDASQSPRLTARPDLLAANALVDASRQDVWTARLGLAPELDANAQFVAGNAESFSGATQYWLVQLRLRWRIFDGGQTYGLIRESGALVRQASANQQRLSREAQRILGQAKEQVETGISALASARAELAFATEALTSARALFNSGEVGYLELLDAQTGRFGADEAVVIERLRLDVGRLALALARGEEPVPSPVTE